MKWIVCLIIALVCLFSAIVFTIVRLFFKKKNSGFFKPLNILFAGVAVAAVALFMPIFISTFETTNCTFIETFFISLNYMIKLFVVDADFSFILESITDAPEVVFDCYSILFSVLFVLAPILTFGFVASLFKNIYASFACWAHFWCERYIFSELNEKSLALAKSLRSKKGKKRFFVFCDVYESEEEKISELVQQAKEIGAVCFEKDITVLKLKTKNLNFFTIGEDESENLNQAVKIIEKYKYRTKTNLYVFSTLIEAEMVISGALKATISKQSKKEDEERVVLPAIKVRRINHIRSLILRTLYDTGYESIFQNDNFELDEDGLKKINAVVVGMGKAGREMTKALAWFCQMTGYVPEINAIDLYEKAEDRFLSLCPELMDERFNGKKVPGDARYTINIHSGFDVRMKSFDDLIMSLPKATYVFVAVGNDEQNIYTAHKMRTLYAQMGCTPAIQTVVYSSDKKNALVDATNFQNQKYDIQYLGDLDSSYSEDVIISSDIEEKALLRHLKWGDEDSFWMYDYNYKSSIASAIHKEMKIKCGVPGIEKIPMSLLTEEQRENSNIDVRSEEDTWAIRRLEHCRWDAYMRSEGYVYGGSTDKKIGRNDMAKKHNCLVPFDELPYAEQIKDDF